MARGGRTRLLMRVFSLAGGCPCPAPTTHTSLPHCSLFPPPLPLPCLVSSREVLRLSPPSLQSHGDLIPTSPRHLKRLLRSSSQCTGPGPRKPRVVLRLTVPSVEWPIADGSAVGAHAAAVRRPAAAGAAAEPLSAGAPGVVPMVQGGPQGRRAQRWQRPFDLPILPPPLFTRKASTHADAVTRLVELAISDDRSRSWSSRFSADDRAPLVSLERIPADQARPSSGFSTVSGLLGCWRAHALDLGAAAIPESSTRTSALVARALPVIYPR